MLNYGMFQEVIDIWHVEQWFIPTIYAPNMSVHTAIHMYIPYLLEFQMCNLYYMLISGKMLLKYKHEPQVKGQVLA